MFVDITISVTDEQFQLLDLNRKLMRKCITESFRGKAIKNILWVKETGKEGKHPHYHLVVETDECRADNLKRSIRTRLNKTVCKDSKIPESTGVNRKGNKFYPVYTHAIPDNDDDLKKAIGYCFKESDHVLLENTWDENYIKTCCDYYNNHKKLSKLAAAEKKTTEITLINTFFKKYLKFMQKIENPMTVSVTIPGHNVVCSSDDKKVYYSNGKYDIVRTAFAPKYIIAFVDAMAHRTSYLCMAKVNYDEFSRLGYAALKSERNLDKVSSDLNSSDTLFI